MLDFHVKRCSRKCCRTDREFEPGETFFSVLVAAGGEVERQDYAAAAWDGPPEGAIGWWKSQMPSLQARRTNLAPNDVILQYFLQLEEDADAEDPLQKDVQYVLALLMVRRRIMRLDDMERDEAGRERLVLFCPRNESEYKVEVITPTQSRAAEIQEQFARLLYADAN